LLRKYKKPGVAAGLRLQGKDCGSGQLQIAGGLLATLGYDFEADLLALVQRAHAGALHGRDVHEHIFRAIVRLNEAVALLGVKEFHSSFRHQEFPFSRFLLNARAIIALAVTSQVFGSSLEAQPKTGSVAR
jgi:hypothetical protein